MLLSWPKFFLFFDAQLVLSTDNGENDNYENCDSNCDNKMSEGRCSLSMLEPPSSKPNLFALWELDPLYLRHCEYSMSTLPSTPVVLHYH